MVEGEGVEGEGCEIGESGEGTCSLNLTVSVISPLHFSFHLSLYSSLHLPLSPSLSPLSSLPSYPPSTHRLM